MYAILLGVFALACTAVLSVIALYFLSSREAAEQPAAVAQAPVPPPPQEEEEEEEAPPPPAPVAQKQVKRPVTTGASAAPAAPRPPPLGAKGSVKVTFSGAIMPGSLSVSCTGGFGGRGSVSGGSATVTDVPTGDTCTGFPKGVVTTGFPVRAGGSYNCQIIGTTTSCN